MDFTNYLKNYPDANGRFGEFGGSYLPPQLQEAFDEITKAYRSISLSSRFISELRRIRRDFQGRPTPITHCENLSRQLGDGTAQ
ncbi:MAG: tryptophan synthase subunit beta, partial [Thermoguttaceae bacterium]|nr:tryptophan synthase subunit beta [Thermoguttaceae bacterium]